MDREPDEQLFQFTLWQMFCFTTLVALLCAVAACAPYFGRNDFASFMLLLAAMGWPVLSAIAVSRIAGLKFMQRVFLFFCIGGAICVLFYCSIYYYVVQLSPLEVLVVTVPMALGFWVPQLMVVLASVRAIIEKEERRRTVAAEHSTNEL